MNRLGAAIARLRHMAVLGIVLAAPATHGLPAAAWAAPAPRALDRTVLPIPDPQYPRVTTLDARNATPPPRFEVKAPTGAPNVLVILIDDMGFGAPSALGGPIHMPTMERLASQGLEYNMFHTTALCSPTRTALLTGRNHHTNNAGAIMELATAFPGNTGIRPGSVAPLAEMLRLNGYSTAAFGKYHETPPWEISLSGPFDRWPTHSGFDKFYGFIGGETNQWSPMLYDGTTKVELPSDPNYHLTVDLADHAISWVRTQQALTPDKPFFIYFAPGATHAPHHVPKEWSDKYKGRFDGGWDQLRQQTLARQIQLGVVPAGTPLAKKPDAIKDWADLTPDEKRLFARQMEVYAGFGEQTDHEIGRLIDAISDMGALDNTLVIYIAGDNGASAEGGMVGMFNESTYFNGVPETVAEQLKHLDEWGGPHTYPHMAAGWAVATDTPFEWTKQVASSFGGTRNGMVIRWPKRIKAHGELRSQFCHVTDIAPTVMEAAGLPFPKTVDGAAQIPFEGVSLLYTFDNAHAASRHTTQYFEIFGNRAIYHDGWLAGTVHMAPWERTPRHPLDQDVWELYDTRGDFSLTHDLATQNPGKLKEMQSLFMSEATRYHVLPIDDRGIDRLDPARAGRPDLMGKRTSLTVYDGMTAIGENAFINVKNRSSTITAEVEIPTGGANGVLLCQGGRFGGWSAYIAGGKPAFTYNFVGMKSTTITATKPLPAGKSTIKFDFRFDGGGPGAGGVETIYVNGTKVAEGRIERTQANIFSVDDLADVGVDEGTPVVESYGDHTKNRFGGRIQKITIDVGPLASEPDLTNAKKSSE